jgi:hypothetical protein
MPHQVVLWFGYPLRKEKFVANIGNRSYWWCTMLCNREMHIFAFRL